MKWMLIANTWVAQQATAISLREAQLCAALSLETVATMVSYQLLLTREGFGKQQTIPKTDKVLNHVRDIGSADTPISALLSSPAKTRLKDPYIY